MSAQIIIDSTVDLRPELLSEVKVARLSILFGSETYVDGKTLTKQEFYTKLVSSDVLPTTSQATPFVFSELYKETIEEGNEAVVITISSKLSGTFQSANIASMDYEGKVYVVDSLNAAIGAGVLAEFAIRLAKVGLSAKQIYNILEEEKHNVCLIALLDTLDYLHRGGRLDKKSAIIGNLAKVKPIIYVSPKGFVEMYSKTIGLKKSMKFILNVALENEVDTNYPFYSIYTYGTENPEKFEAIAKECGIEVTDRVQFGPVVGTHCGPEAYGCIYISKK